MTEKSDSSSRDLAATAILGQVAGKSRLVEIQIDGLQKAFDGKSVLRGVDLSIHYGDVIAVVGGSGCGKTVLMKHILGRLSPDSGRILVRDHSLPNSRLVDLARCNEQEKDSIHTHWGVVFQNNALFSGSVFDNFALWLREIRNLHNAEIAAAARDALTAVSLPCDRKFLESDVASLSGGMAKRLAVARALSMKPDIYFYDEPTTGLDPTSAGQIHELIIATHQRTDTGLSGHTSIIITHDKDLLQRLRPRIVMLHSGKVHFDGAFRDFEDSDSDVIRPYFDLMPLLHG